MFYTKAFTTHSKFQIRNVSRKAKWLAEVGTVMFVNNCEVTMNDFFNLCFFGLHGNINIKMYRKWKLVSNGLISLTKCNVGSPGLTIPNICSQLNKLSQWTYILSKNTKKRNTEKVTYAYSDRKQRSNPCKSAFLNRWQTSDQKIASLNSVNNLDTTTCAWNKLCSKTCLSIFQQKSDFFGICCRMLKKLLF